MVGGQPDAQKECKDRNSENKNLQRGAKSKTLAKDAKCQVPNPNVPLEPKTPCKQVNTIGSCCALCAEAGQSRDRDPKRLQAD